MQTIRIGLTLTILAGAAFAQQPSTQPMHTYTSADQIKELIAKAKSQRTNNQPTIVQNILRVAPYQASLEYRASVGPAAVHEKEAEFFYVIDGSGTLTTGGKLIDAKRNGSNLTGTGIEGGTQQKVAKGDFIVVPENTPHWYNKIDGVLVLMSLHVPRPVPSEAK